MDSAVLRQRTELIGLCCLPELKQLKITFKIELFDIERWFQSTKFRIPDIARDVFEPMQRFGDMCTKVFKHASVETGVYVTTELFQPFDEYWPPMPPERADDILDELFDKEHNYVVFRAHLSQSGDPYAFRGMKLELEDCAHMDRNRLDEIIEEEL